MVLGASIPALAVTAPQAIRVDVYPFVASLGSNAEGVEISLIHEAVHVCGTLDNMKSLQGVELHMGKTRTTQIDPKGTAGAPNFKSVLMLVYPRVTGTANVICEK